MSAWEPQAVKDLRGVVERGPYARGTKSAREALFLRTAENRYLLRRKEGPPSGDIELNRYVGQVVECSGFLIDKTLLAESIRIVV